MVCNSKQIGVFVAVCSARSMGWLFRAAFLLSVADMKALMIAISVGKLKLFRVCIIFVLLGLFLVVCSG